MIKGAGGRHFSQTQRLVEHQRQVRPSAIIDGGVRFSESFLFILGEVGSLPFQLTHSVLEVAHGQFAGQHTLYGSILKDFLTRVLNLRDMARKAHSLLPRN